jgi:hypothetical protein
MFNKIRTSVMILALSAPAVLKAQDLHFSDVQGMAQWYNASLKQDRQSNLIANFRDIRYQSNLAFNTGTVLLNLSMETKENQKLIENRSYGTLSLGGAFDKSNSSLYRNNLGLLGYSYALKLNDKGMYMAAGFQGTLTNYRLGSNGTYQDQYDQYGPIRGGLSNDPLRFGKRYTYFSLNAGWSLFQRSERADWYMGLSMRHVNRPFTEETKANNWRLPVTTGVQAGVSLKNDFSRVDLFGMMNVKAKAHEWIGGLRYNFLLGDNSADEASNVNQNVILGFGALYRVNDAVIPEVQLSVGKTAIGLHYDMNMSGIRAGGFTRRGFELMLSQKL